MDKMPGRAGRAIGRGRATTTRTHPGVPDEVSQHGGGLHLTIPVVTATGATASVGDGRRRGKVTVATIARLAGVSAPTVSRVINGQAGVALSTRRRVEAVLHRVLPLVPLRFDTVPFHLQRLERPMRKMPHDHARGRAQPTLQSKAFEPGLSKECRRLGSWLRRGSRLARNRTSRPHAQARVVSPIWRSRMLDRESARAHRRGGRLRRRNGRVIRRRTSDTFACDAGVCCVRGRLLRVTDGSG